MLHNNRPGVINADKPWRFMDANGAACVCRRHLALCPCCLGPQSQALCPCLHSNQGGVLTQVNTSEEILCDVGIIY